jgi:phenylpyruvate tautomerase PptA (4-oxalocrotonate tautomerase family)
MPTIVVEGPRLSLSTKRKLARELTALVASAYEWPEENIVVILRENSDENVARGGILRYFWLIARRSGCRTAGLMGRL